MLTIDSDAEHATFINAFRCRPEDQDEVVRINIDIVEQVARHHDGFISAAVHRSTDGTRVINYLQWRSPRKLADDAGFGSVPADRQPVRWADRVRPPRGHRRPPPDLRMAFDINPDRTRLTSVARDMVDLLTSPIFRASARAQPPTARSVLDRFRPGQTSLPPRGNVARSASYRRHPQEARTPVRIVQRDSSASSAVCRTSRLAGLRTVAVRPSRSRGIDAAKTVLSAAA